MLSMVGCARPIVLAFVFVVGCARHHPGADDGEVDGGYVADACVGLSCFQYDCASKGLQDTTVSGTVYAPNGTLPLFGVNVYVPSSDPGPLTQGVTCGRCDAGLPGGALVSTTTDEAGNFTLTGVPATTDVPLVIQVGKWRRQLSLPTVAACQTLPADKADTTLPKSTTDMTPNTTGVDLPQIAISTGGADALECLILKLGIDPKEFTISTKGGRVHMYTNLGAPLPNPIGSGTGRGTDSFIAGWAGGGGDAFTDSEALWNSADNLKKYDIVLLSCEGDQYQGSKPQAALDNMHTYAGLGGRVFMSHWQNIWVGGQNGAASHGEADWEGVATWDFGAAQNETTQLAIIDETVPKGMSFATWLQNVGATTTRDQLTVNTPRYTCQSNDPTMSERWVYVDPTLSTPLGKVSVQDLEFTTPLDQAPADRCGKVVFSDMHVASGSSSNAGVAFPSQCSTTDLSPQEKALAFIFFDISSCVGSIF